MVSTLFQKMYIMFSYNSKYNAFRPSSYYRWYAFTLWSSGTHTRLKPTNLSMFNNLLSQYMYMYL